MMFYLPGEDNCKKKVSYVRQKYIIFLPRFLEKYVYGMPDVFFFDEKKNERHYLFDLQMAENLLAVCNLGSALVITKY